MKRKAKQAAPKQISTINISELVLQARNEGIKDHIEIAKWIIARSEHWKREGFQEIMKAMKAIAN